MFFLCLLLLIKIYLINLSNKLKKLKMKKIILTVIAVLGFAFANAQKVEFGAKAGLNLANLIGDVQNNSTRVGFLVGTFAEIKVAQKFSIQPELLYSTQGLKYDGGKLLLDYLNVPVLVKYYVESKFSLEAGPQIGFLLSAKDKFDGKSVSREVDTKDEYEKIDFGLNFGLGYNLTEKLSIGARYNLHRLLF